MDYRKVKKEDGCRNGTRSEDYDKILCRQRGGL